MGKIIVFKNNNGDEIYSEYVEGDFNISFAEEKYNNDILTVSRLIDFKPGEYSKRDAAAIIENEGAGYAVESYTSFKRMKSKKVAVAWLNAELSIVNLKKITKYNEVY